MWTDLLVEEVRQRRRELMAEFDFNPKKVLEELRNERVNYLDRLASALKVKSDTINKLQPK